MNVFEAVKDEVTAKAAAISYGIKVKYNGMAVCPFHDDKNPSMKLGSRYYCFGCQAKGDVIDFTSNLFGLSLYKAAEKLADDFRIRYDRTHYRHTGNRSSVYSAVSERNARLKALKEYREQERRCFIALCEYFHMLNEWKERFAPKPTDADWNPLFCEALQKLDYIEYLLDVMLYGNAEDKAEIVGKFSKRAEEFKQIS